MKPLYILVAILVFGILVAVHELGHFFAAKLCGVRVNEFSIGMGPALWSRQRGETQYSLRALPIGGFCAMEGEDEESEDQRSLSRQGFWKQFVIFAAGSFMNLLTGFLIVLALYSGFEAFRVPALAGAAPEFSQVNGAELQAGDVIWSINGERVYRYEDVEMLLSLAKGRPLDVVFLRDGEKVSLQDLPRGTYTGNDGKTYQGYGFFISTNTMEEATAGAKLKVAWLNTLDFARIVRLSLGMLLSGEAGMQDLSGPVGIVDTMTQQGEAAQKEGGVRAAMESIFYFAALLAVNLAIMNMLPIPGLDGGHILFLLVDEVSLLLFKRKVPAKYATAVNTAGLVVLMGFMALVTFQDVFKLLR